MILPKTLKRLNIKAEVQGHHYLSYLDKDPEGHKKARQDLIKMLRDKPQKSHEQNWWFYGSHTDFLINGERVPTELRCAYTLTDQKKKVFTWI